MSSRHGRGDRRGRFARVPNNEPALFAIKACIIEPIWHQFCHLVPTRRVDHPLGCHRHRVPVRVVFDKLAQAPALKADDRLNGLELGEVVIDTCITKASGGGAVGPKSCGS